MPFLHNQIVSTAGRPRSTVFGISFDNRQLTSQPTLSKMSRPIEDHDMRISCHPPRLLMSTARHLKSALLRHTITTVLLAQLLFPTSAVQAQHAAAHSWPADSESIHYSLTQFLTAFENLEWEPFRAAFSDSASVFHPAPDMAERVAGRPAIEATFARVFAELRNAAPGGPPYHRLDPRELEIRSLGPDVALVTFQLHNSLRLARRTVIFRRENGRWRITHLHASNMPSAPK